MSSQLGLVFLVLFVFAASACIYLSITMSITSCRSSRIVVIARQVNDEAKLGSVPAT